MSGDMPFSQLACIVIGPILMVAAFAALFAGDHRTWTRFPLTQAASDTTRRR
jgi:hypothetical protein